MFENKMATFTLLPILLFSRTNCSFSTELPRILHQLRSWVVGPHIVLSSTIMVG